MKRPFLILYGLTAYVMFNVTFIYMLGFLLGYDVPQAPALDHQGSTIMPTLINVGLVFLFGFFHSLMARDSFKSWWTKIIPEDAERSTYVVQSALFLGISVYFWQPMDQVIWSTQGTASTVAYVIFAIGLVVMLLSTFLIDHFELFGLKQVWFANQAMPAPAPQFRTPSLYRFVRHPMQVGVILLMIGTPHMTAGHLMFAALMTLYVMIGLWFEEKALLREFGDTYRAYQARVPMIIPRLWPAKL